MTLHLEDSYVWDFWLAPRLSADEPFHCYFLQAPRSLPDPEMRHDRARIGHATSPNLIHWTYHGMNLPLGNAGEWDDWTQWTGSVVRHEGTNYLFYTGRSKSEQGNVQRIGIAVSDDLYRWRKLPANPIVEAVSPWYAPPGPGGNDRSDCRDPWVLRFEGQWLMYFTASAADAPRESCGVVGIATSPDLLNWTVGPPVATPGIFGEVEVPEVFPIGAKWAMLFCTAKHASIDGKRATWNGTHYFLADSPYGPFELAPGPLLLADERGSNYAARAVLDPWIGNVIMAFRRHDDAGIFVGDLIDPLPLVIDEANTSLRVVQSE